MKIFDTIIGFGLLAGTIYYHLVIKPRYERLDSIRATGYSGVNWNTSPKRRTVSSAPVETSEEDYDVSDIDIINGVAQYTAAKNAGYTDTDIERAVSKVEYFRDH